jgi:hypothetical protein
VVVSIIRCEGVAVGKSGVNGEKDKTVGVAVGVRVGGEVLVGIAVRVADGTWVGVSLGIVVTVSVVSMACCAQPASSRVRAVRIRLNLYFIFPVL